VGAPRIHVIPILIVIVLFLATARVIHAIQDAPKPTAAVEVTAIGHQFWWEFRYPALGIVMHCLARPST
jgi:cytochrome c oxidase subunit 2